MRLFLAAALLALAILPVKAETALFAGGCFWCMEHDFEKVSGVTDVISGYTGGSVEKPTYKQVGSGNTGHAESIQVEFDPAKISYAKLLDVFWRNVDPFDAGGQFCDRGNEYRSAIFVSGAQAAAAKASKAAVEKKLGKAVVTKIEPASTFWPAESYHQNYADRNTAKYSFYRLSCGRDARLAEVWGAM